MEPAWVNADLTGQLDCRIHWKIQPEIPIVTDLFINRLGQVCDIPLFPTVYYYNTLYEQNLLEVALPRLEGSEDVLVLGTGAGLEAVCVAMKYRIHVDATDINPLAVANTIAAGRRTGTDHLIKAWVSDGLTEVQKAYDVILFEAPLATDRSQAIDPNRFDQGGRLLTEVLSALPLHLKRGGSFILGLYVYPIGCIFDPSFLLQLMHDGVEFAFRVAGLSNKVGDGDPGVSGSNYCGYTLARVFWLAWQSFPFLSGVRQMDGVCFFLFHRFS